MAMDDLAQFPDLLQKNLYDCLDSKPSIDALEEYLPAIRDTILQLLQGLKNKQARVIHLQRPPARKSDELSIRIPTPTLSDLDSKPSSTPTIANSDAFLALQQEDTLAQRSTVRRHQERQSTLVPLFLKLGDRVKKATFQSELSLGALKAFFEEVFSTALPVVVDIQIMDPETNIMYELQDIADVQVNTFLYVPAASQESTVTPSLNERLNEMQKIILHEIKLLLPAEAVPGTLLTTGVRSADTFVQEIRDQQRELVQLRQDFADMARVYRTLYTDTTESVSELRAQADAYRQEKDSPSVQQDAKNDTKNCTEQMATMITTQLRGLQGTIDEIKLDVTQRRCKPSEAQLTHCDQKVKELDKAIKSFSSQIYQFKPKWKKIWEEQLQTIVQEQRFLKEHEALLLDLQEDHQSAVEMLCHLRKVYEIQKQQRPQSASIHISPDGNGSEGMAGVFRQLTTIDVDHQRRVKALAQAEEKRAWKLASRIDEFEQELVTFVCSNKLKNTGGPQQVEQQRQKRNEILLKKLFSPADHDVNDASSSTP